MREHATQRAQARSGGSGGAPAPAVAGPEAGASARGQSHEALGGALADQMPANVDLRGVGVSFQLPAGKNLSSTWQRELRTESSSTISLNVTPEALTLECSPPLLIDALWPAQNMELWRVVWRFQDARPEVSIDVVRGLGEGFVDFSKDAKEQVGKLVSGGVAGTPMAKAGYNPLTDKDILKTLQKIAANFENQPASGKGGVGTKDMGRVSAEATLAMKKPFNQAAHGGGLRIPAGGQFTVRVNGGGSVADLMGAHSPGAGVKAAKIQSIELTSNAVEVVKDGQGVAVLNQLRVDRGGKVTVEEFTLEGQAKKASDWEMLFRVLAGTVAVASQGVPGEAALQVAASSRDAQAQIVPGVTRQIIEDALTEGVRKLILDNADALPGVNLAEVFGVQAQKKS